MKLLSGLLFPALIGAVSAFQDASVYIFEGSEIPSSFDTPTLTPEQARLVFAQRLSASKYHDLGDASDETLLYINAFGGQAESIFQDTPKDKAAELVLIVEGVSSQTAGPLLEAWSSINPAFIIANPPSMIANKKLALDLNKQCEQKGQDCSLEKAINPFDTTCWNGNSKVIHLDLVGKSTGIQDLVAAQDRLIQFSKKKEMNVAVVLMPESSRSSSYSQNPYGIYGDHKTVARRQAEEPITEGLPTFPSTLSFASKQVKAVNNSTSPPITGVPALCYSSLDSCVGTTNNCSGHGQCYQKSGSGEGACFACGCQATNETFTYDGGKRTGWTVTYWGGSACHKRDVSSAFWIIALFTVVMIGVVTWGIGLLYSIGEEQLPGVIGAGVSSKSR